MRTLSIGCTTYSDKDLPNRGNKIIICTVYFFMLILCYFELSNERIVPLFWFICPVLERKQAHGLMDELRMQSSAYS